MCRCACSASGPRNWAAIWAWAIGWSPDLGSGSRVFDSLRSDEDVEVAGFAVGRRTKHAPAHVPSNALELSKETKVIKSESMKLAVNALRRSPKRTYASVLALAKSKRIPMHQIVYGRALSYLRHERALRG